VEKLGGIRKNFKRDNHYHISGGKEAVSEKVSRES
jgi:hypothetical protein